MFAVAFLLFASLSLGPQAVLSKFNTILFSSIEQCGPFNVTFNGGSMPATLPLTLTVVAFNSTPIFIPIPRSSWNDTSGTGAAITFLPLAAGSTFVAVLDDGNGTAMGSVSDVIRVAASNDSSCLPSNTTQTTNAFTLQGTLSQCQTFDVTFNQTEHSAPTIRGFIPFGPSFTVDQNEVQNDTGTATYVVNALRGFRIALLLDDGSGTRQTSDLLTIGGDASSSSSCLPEISSTPTAAAKSRVGLSSGGAIAIGVASGSVVGFMLILLAWFFYRERRRRFAQLNANNPTVRIESAPNNPLDSPFTSSPSKLMREKGDTRSNIPQSKYLTGRPYPDFSLSPVTPEFIQTRPPSPQFRTVDLGDGFVEILPVGATSRRSQERANDRLSVGVPTISSLDIAGILEAAAIGSGARDQSLDDDDYDDAASIHSPGRRSTRPSVNQLRLMNSSEFLRPKRNEENLDVPTSATPYGRFSGISSVEHELREPSTATETSVSMNNIRPPRENFTSKNEEVPGDAQPGPSVGSSARGPGRRDRPKLKELDIGLSMGLGRGTVPSRI
ncbi:hypothetical protein EW146_g2019 [Bondarzewia mesenterica]|uniref:Mid2 domain-containing protein n=1 Tax=Bondarzewia mesenterica TaxID=1095465 RepID=A0A4S4M4B1_9AGAM|nr:hypothetical protein EW146_g2019 [Bondarzewia mesenterica]